MRYDQDHPKRDEFGIRVYRPRIADQELKERLRAAGAVLIEGPRACGKTETGRRAAASEVMLDVDPKARAAIAVDPRAVLAGESPRLIDEWQTEPVIWNHIRRAVDKRAGKGHFILTGSAVPPDDITRHTGAGRVGRLRLRPMSLFELDRATGQVSLRPARRTARAKPGDRTRRACRTVVRRRLARTSSGGGDARQPGYVADIWGSRARRRRDPRRVSRFLRSLARNVSTYASLATIARDVTTRSRTTPPAATLAALERLMVVEDQPPWVPHLRRSRLRSSAKRHFVDPSLAVAALTAGPEHLLRANGSDSCSSPWSSAT